MLKNLLVLSIFICAGSAYADCDRWFITHDETVAPRSIPDHCRISVQEGTASDSIYERLRNDQTKAPLDFITVGNSGSTFLKNLPEDLKHRLGLFIHLSEKTIKLPAEKAFKAGVHIQGPSALQVGEKFFKSYLEGHSVEEAVRSAGDDQAKISMTGESSYTVNDSHEDSEEQDEEDSGFFDEGDLFMTPGYGQLDLYLNHRFLSRFSMDSTGDIGFTLGFIDEDTRRLLILDKNPMAGILLSFTAAEFSKELVSFEKEYRGLDLSYAASISARAGYLSLMDQEGETKKYANIGPGFNNDLSVSYGAFEAAASAGIDYLALHQKNMNYIESTLTYKRKNVSMGAYFGYDNITGTLAGAKATINLKALKRKPKAKKK